jgi:cyclohexadienyl dehydratase
MSNALRITLGRSNTTRRCARVMALTLAAWVCTLASPSAFAGPVLDRVKARGSVRVCIWPQYHGITYRNPRNKQLGGIDILLSVVFAQGLNVKLEYVDSSFPMLAENLLKDHCDIAMHAVGITPQRLQTLRFSKPYLRSDIYGVATRTSRAVQRWSDIDTPGIRVAVQAGTFIEPVMAAALKQATLVVIKPPLTRELELEAGRVDVFMTDYPYSRHLLDNADWARLVAPPQVFHRVDYAYAVKPGDEQWLEAVNNFVAAIKRDGRLKDAAKLYGLTEIMALD